MTFVVVGAGPTGVEMAGQIAELAARAGRRLPQHRHQAAPGWCWWTPRPGLPPFGEKLSAAAHKQLERIGVEVQLGAKVADVDRDGST